MYKEEDDYQNLCWDVGGCAEEQEEGEEGGEEEEGKDIEEEEGEDSAHDFRLGHLMIL